MKLSLIIPCYNEEESLEKLYKEIVNSFKNIQYELLFVNDGSKDDTSKIIKKLYKEDPDHVKGINFSRNFGKESAIYAGIVNASGEYTAIIDADLQQHPKYVFEMVKYLDENEDVDQVAMYISNRDTKTLRSKLSNIFYKAIDFLSDTEFKMGASDFRTFRKNIRDSIKEMSEVNRFSKGLFSWIGFNTVYLPYEVKKRESGKSKFSFKKLVRYALDGFIGFSTKPLKFITYLGIISTIIAFIYFIIIIVQKLFFVVDVSGYSSIMAVILFFSGVQIISIGILGEYLSKTYLEAKKRPIYLEKDKIGFKDKTNIL